MKTRRIILATGLILLLLTVCGCGKTKQVKEEENMLIEQHQAIIEDIKGDFERHVQRPGIEDLTIGICGLNGTDAYSSLMRKAITNSCYALVINGIYAPGTAAEGILDLLDRSQSGQKLDGILIFPGTASDLAGPLENLIRTGIPILNIGVQFGNADLEELSEEIPFFGTDEYVAAMEAGNQVAGRFYGNNNLTLILNGTAASTADSDKYEGFYAGAKDSIQIVENHYLSDEAVDHSSSSGETAASLEEQIAQILDNVLASTPDLKIIYSTNDEISQTVAEYIQSKGLTTEINLLSIGCSYNSIQSASSQELLFLVREDPYEIGYKGMMYLLKMINGDEIGTYIDNGYDLITADNAADYLGTVRTQETEIDFEELDRAKEAKGNES